MGAEPRWFFLAITLPRADIGWLDQFASGLEALAMPSGIELAGGDTTFGPLSITITAVGLIDRGKALLRSTAKAGDLVLVSGTPGLAAWALAQLKSGSKVESRAFEALTRPQPRIELGRALVGKATACIDVSDGLAADLRHIATASGVGAEIWLDRLPGAEVLASLPPETRWDLQLGGGDDYELCFCLPPEMEQQVSALARRGGVDLTVIGRLTEGPGMCFVKPDGAEFVPSRAGFDHFSDDAPELQSVPSSGPGSCSTANRS